MQCVLKGYATCSSLGKIVLVSLFGVILSILLAALHSQPGRQGHYGARMYKAICGLASLCT